MTENNQEEDIDEYTSIGVTEEILNDIDLDEIESIIDQNEIDFDIKDKEFDIDLDLDF